MYLYLQTGNRVRILLADSLQFYFALIMMILIIYQTLPAALIENSHFNSKLVCLAMLKLYSAFFSHPHSALSGLVWMAEKLTVKF